jgi:hypothetical protein
VQEGMALNCCEGKATPISGSPIQGWPGSIGC